MPRQKHTEQRFLGSINRDLNAGREFDEEPSSEEIRAFVKRYNDKYTHGSEAVRVSHVTTLTRSKVKIYFPHSIVYAAKMQEEKGGAYFKHLIDHATLVKNGKRFPRYKWPDGGDLTPWAP